MHHDVYNMPVYLRRFYLKKLTEYKKKESDEIKKSQRKKSSSSPSRPAINPRFKR